MQERHTGENGREALVKEITKEDFIELKKTASIETAQHNK